MKESVGICSWVKRVSYMSVWLINSSESGWIIQALQLDEVNPMFLSPRNGDTECNRYILDSQILPRTHETQWKQTGQIPIWVSLKLFRTVHWSLAYITPVAVKQCHGQWWSLRVLPGPRCIWRSLVTVASLRLAYVSGSRNIYFSDYYFLSNANQG